MKEWILSYLTRFSTAVTHLFELPFQLPHDKKVSLALPWFPIAGVLVGMLAFLMAILLRWIFGPLVSSVAMAAIFPAFLYFIVDGRHINSLLKVAKHSHKKQTNPPQNEVLTHLKEHASLWVLLMLIGCKVLAVGFLTYHGFCSWLILIPMYSAATYAEFLKRAHGLKVTPLKNFLPWFIALILAIAIVGINGFAMGCVWWFLSHQFFGWVAKQEQRLITPFFYSMVEVLECMAILAGLFLL